jgi:hypothetical protein
MVENREGTSSRTSTRGKIRTCGKRVLLAGAALLVALTSSTQARASSLDTGEAIREGGSSETAEEWAASVLASLREGGPAMKHAAEYIVAHDVQIRFRNLGEGAMWWIDGNMYLNANRYSPQTRPDHPGMLALIVHEAKHLEQGPVVALSVYGELEAWQAQYAAFGELSGIPPGTYEARMAWQELSEVPQSYSRDELSKARELIQFIGGASYPIDKLPLLPLGAGMEPSQ